MWTNIWHIAARSILSIKCCSSSINWKIVQFDNDKTISNSELKKEYPIINWYSKAGLTMRSVSTVFRIYVKEMPEQGPCLRNEIIASSNDSTKLFKKIKEIAKGVTENTPDDFISNELLKKYKGSKDI